MINEGKGGSGKGSTTGGSGGTAGTPGRSASLESTASVSAGTAGRYTGSAAAGGGGQGVQTPTLVVTYGRDLHDSCAAIIWCPKHEKLALSRIGTGKGLWLPTTAIRQGEGWYDSIQRHLKTVLRVSREERGKAEKSYLSFRQPPALIHVLRCQMPQYLDFITRCVFSTELTHESKHPSNCCPNKTSASGLVWVSGEEIMNGRAKELWGPEPRMFVDAILNKRLQSVDNYSEFCLKDVMRYAPKEEVKTYQEELVKSADYKEREIAQLYGQFAQHSFPSQYMTGHSFVEYLTKAGLPATDNLLVSDPWSLFRAFTQCKPFMTFHEFLLGLCALEARVVHGGHTGELRATYMYYYYVKLEDKDQGMDSEAISRVVQDVKRSNGQTLEGTALEEEVRRTYQAIGLEMSQKITSKVFVKSIGDKKLRGTAKLLRSSASPLEQLRLKPVYEMIALQKQTPEAMAQQSDGTAGASIPGTCMRCRQKKYTLAAHSVKLSRDGLVVDPHENRNQSDVQRMGKSLRRMSDQCFVGSTTANVLLDILRAYGKSAAVSGQGVSGGGQAGAGTRGQVVDWGQRNERQGLVERIDRLLSQAELVFKGESRVVRVSSPVYVLGDIHGNLHDIMVYERSLWKMGPTCLGQSFLFLGDYVDRGEHSVECILYLLCHKVLCPQKYWLLRGNHELRSVNQSFTFRNECLEKFGESVGQKLWQKFNTVFDFMPICAVIDESIYCAHGGIPTGATTIDELYAIPAPLKEAESESPIAWQILWNDPITNQEFRDYQQSMPPEPSSSSQTSVSSTTTSPSGATAASNVTGFLPNTKRGTAFYFSEQALNRFLNANQLSHVIRAHEVIPNGFAYHMGGRCITIFSSSRYCGGLNEAAVILVADHKIRVIKIETY